MIDNVQSGTVARIGSMQKRIERLERKSSTSECNVVQIFKVNIDKIFLFSGGAEELVEYDKTSVGLAAALSDAIAYDYVWLPNGTYIGDFTVPAGVLLQCAGWNTHINGTVVLGNESTLIDCKITNVVSDADKVFAVSAPDSGFCMILNCYITCNNALGEGYGISTYAGGDVYVYDSVVFGSTGDLEC